MTVTALSVVFCLITITAAVRLIVQASGADVERSPHVVHMRFSRASGKMESVDDSPFRLLRPHDLATLMAQTARVDRVDFLRQKMASLSEPSLASFKSVGGGGSGTGAGAAGNTVNDYREQFYANEPNCLKLGPQLTKLPFYESYVIDWRGDGFTLPTEENDDADSDDDDNDDDDYYYDGSYPSIPMCDRFVDLPFSMKTFDHLESIQAKESLQMQADVDLAKNCMHPPIERYGRLIRRALGKNATSWVYLSMAGDYFKIKGDFANAVKCLQRAIYHATSRHHYIPKLSLASMLQKMHKLNDSLVVALASINPYTEVGRVSSAYTIGNVYTSLGELQLARDWFDVAWRKEPTLQMARVKAGAIECHIRLENYLEEQHGNLQRKLEQLKEYQSYADELYRLSRKLESEQSSPARRSFAKQLYRNFMLNSSSMICDWEREDDTVKTPAGAQRPIQLDCRQIDKHYTHFPFNSLSDSIRVLHNQAETAEQSRNQHDSKPQHTGLFNGNENDDDDIDFVRLRTKLMSEKRISKKCEPPNSHESNAN